jgi:hypothetical protein
MEHSRDEQALIAELRSLRPQPRAEFASELDALAAAGFRARRPVGRARQAAAWIDSISLRRALAPAAAAVLLALLIATAAVRLSDRGGPVVEGRGPVTHSGATTRAHPYAPSAGAAAAGTAEESASRGAGAASGFQYEQVPAATAHRDVERGAQLVLRAPADEVPQDARRVFDAVHAAHGIVLSSSVNAWEHGGAPRAGRAMASFELLVPSARLDDTLTELSRIADVRSRHDSTADITAATVSVESRLRDARARIESLLAQLASAESEEERALIEARLRRQRRAAAALGTSVGRLHRRADYAHLSLRIEGGDSASSGGGAWGVDDALRDALGLLSTAAGVTLLVLVVIAPIALLGLLTLLARRAWARRARERALG